MHTYSKTSSQQQMPVSSLLSRLDQIHNELHSIEQVLPKLPQGTAAVYTCNGRKRISGRLNGKNHFFSRREAPLVKKLMLRQYLELRRDELLHLKQVLDAQIDYENKWMGSSERYIAEHPDHLEMLSEFFTEKSEPLTAWMNTPDLHAAPHQENRTIQVTPTLYVRSKAESMIAIVLYRKGLPFRYEDPLLLGETVYYPDFTIRSPKTRAVYYYEHFGMMDDEDYAGRAMDKLTDYVKHGLIPSINLIMTFETKSDPLDVIRIENALEIIA